MCPSLQIQECRFLDGGERHHVATNAAQVLACERTVEKFEPVLAPEDFTRWKHIAWRPEDAMPDCLSGQLVVHLIKLGIARPSFADRLGVEPCPLSGSRKCDRIGKYSAPIPRAPFQFQWRAGVHPCPGA